MRIFRLTAFMLIVILAFSFSVSALDGGLDVEPISSEEYNVLNESLGEIRYLTEEPENGKFTGFALKDDGTFALDFLTNDFIKHTRHNICVYDQNGVFQYGISFMYRSLYIEWNGENIAVFEPGSDSVYAEFTPTGELVTTSILSISDKNNDHIRYAKRQKKTAGDYTYSEHKCFPLNADYSTLINDNDGTVLYQAEKGYKSFSDYFIIGFLIVFVLALPTVVVPAVIVNVIRKKNKTEMKK